MYKIRRKHLPLTAETDNCLHISAFWPVRMRIALLIVRTQLYEEEHPKFELTMFLNCSPVLSNCPSLASFLWVQVYFQEFISSSSFWRMVLWWKSRRAQRRWGGWSRRKAQRCHQTELKLFDFRIWTGIIWFKDTTKLSWNYLSRNYSNV